MSTHWHVGQLLEQFHLDLDTLGLGRQRQYENRSTFRNLLLQVGRSPEFIVNLMTHPTPKRASDFYTRLEMQWQAMCQAILLLKHSAWELDGPPPDKPPHRVTQGVTSVPYTDEKAPSSERLRACTDWRGVRDSNPWPPA